MSANFSPFLPHSSCGVVNGAVVIYTDNNGVRGTLKRVQLVILWQSRFWLLQ